MAQWSIGPIVGQYQPEDFTERQGVEYEEVKAFGIIRPLIWKSWSPREVTLSFVVNAMGITASEQIRNTQIVNAPDQSDPEVVWATICAMMRPGDRGRPPELGGRSTDPRSFPRVVIPGWNLGGNTPFRAVVTDASIKRTHMAGTLPPRAVRAIITVSLKEVRSNSREGGDRGTTAQRSRTAAAAFNTLAGSFLPPRQPPAETT